MILYWLNNINSIINETATSCVRPSNCVSTMIVQTLCDCCVRLSRSLPLSASLYHTASPMTQCTEFCEKWNDFWECDGYDVDGFLTVWISTSIRTTHAQANAWKIIKSECKHLIGTASVHDTKRYGLPAKYICSKQCIDDTARSTLKRRNGRSRFEYARPLRRFRFLIRFYRCLLLSVQWSMLWLKAIVVIQ